MSKKSSIKPSSFSDAITEKHYARNLSKQEKLVQVRKDLVRWLRTKGAGNEKALALADRLQMCRRKRRCKSVA
ncbi:MAG: hypothetical protein WBG18_19630 [Xanthobacteraceae bacterium]|jgi:hypothetical protein